MNYYEHHIGDYLRDTAHLSLLEHGIYRRLLDLYYTREEPLPAAQVMRLVGARSDGEEAAVRDVLNEFFQRDGEVYRHSRCDREIERYRAKQAKAAFSAQARWSKSERNANAMRTHSECIADAQQPQCEGNALQTPDTRHQTPSERIPERAPDPPSPTAAGKACLAIRQTGFAGCNPSDPRLLALLAQGATDAELADVAREAAEKRKGWAWLLATVEGRRRDAAEIVLAKSPDPPRNTDAERTAAMLEADRKREAELRSPEGQAAVKAAVEAVKARLVRAA